VKSLKESSESSKESNECAVRSSFALFAVFPVLLVSGFYIIMLSQFVCLFVAYNIITVTATCHVVAHFIVRYRNMLSVL